MEMASFYDEIEIEDFEYDPDEETYYYPCPCGDRFQITKEELRAGEETATCPSCSLIVKVIYDKEDFQEGSKKTSAEEAEEEEEKLITSIKALEVN